MLTLKEYNIKKAEEMLNSGLTYTFYSDVYHQKIDIRTANVKNMNCYDKTKFDIAIKNIENLKEIAAGKQLSDIYTMFYYDLYVPEEKKKEEEENNKKNKKKRGK